MAGNDGYLYSVPSDADPDDGRLRDPTTAEVVAVTITCVGIASAEAFGTPAIEAALAPPGITSAEAIGAPALVAVLAPTGIASAEAFGTPSVQAGVEPSGIASAEAFGAPTVTPVAVQIIDGPDDNDTLTPSEQEQEMFDLAMALIVGGIMEEIS